MRAEMHQLPLKSPKMLNKISFFQLDNLINNRVPFLFLNMSQSVVPWYTSVSRMHIESYEIMTTEADLCTALESKKAPKDYAIVLLCQDGQSSLKAYSQLEKLGYTNVYVIDGGYQQMVTERSQI
jgi:rhodanese-related sulfurtransferase